MDGASQPGSQPACQSSRPPLADKRQHFEEFVSSCAARTGHCVSRSIGMPGALQQHLARGSRQNLRKMLLPALYRSARRAARLCDCNPGLRRHLLTRFVREDIYIDGIASQEDIRRLSDAPGFSLVRAVSAHFRKTSSDGAAKPDSDSEVTVAFKVTQSHVYEISFG